MTLDQMFASLWHALDDDSAPLHDIHWLIMRCIDVRCTGPSGRDDSLRNFLESVERHNTEFPGWRIPTASAGPSPEHRLDRIAFAAWARAGCADRFDGESHELLLSCANAQLLRGSARSRNVAEIESELKRRNLVV